MAEGEGHTQIEPAGDGLPHPYAVADLVVSRADPTTVFELLALCNRSNTTHTKATARTPALQ